VGSVAGSRRAAREVFCSAAMKMPMSLLDPGLQRQSARNVEGAEFRFRGTKQVLMDRETFPATEFVILVVKDIENSFPTPISTPMQLADNFAQVDFGFPAALWNSGRERDGRVQHAQQEQTLVILLQTILSHLAHDEIQNLRQCSGSVLREQLLQAGQAKFFITGIGHFRYAVGNHQEEIAR
jgi:hypothetical protein